ncbi:MAG TPA: TolC family protein [Candidatus Baltobacteraceae bacterium]|jgi:outer membrane protein TolC
MNLTNRRVSLGCIVLTGLLASVPLHAAAAGMSLPDAVRYALAHSPAIVKQEAVVAQAHETYIKQRAASLPPVTGTLQNTSQKSNNLQGNFAQVGLQQQSIFSQNTAQIGTQYSLYTGGLSIIQKLVADQQLQSAKADLRKTQNQVATDVTTDFYTVATKDETVRLDQGDVDYKHTLEQIAQAKVNAGVAAGVDVLQAHANEEQSRSLLVSSQAGAQSARDVLAQAIGAPLDTQFAVPRQVAQPPLPAQSLDQLVAIAQSHRPDVASAQDALRVATLNRRTLNQDLFPTVQLTAALGNQFTPTSAGQPSICTFDPALCGGGTARGPQPRGNPGFWVIGATSTFNLPLVDYGQRKANKENFDEQIASARSGLDQTNEQVAVDVRQAYRSAQTALAQLRFTQEEVKAGVESARVARLQYQNGLKALTDVIAAQQTGLSAQIDLFNARVSYVDAIVKLRVALGIYDAGSAVADLR